MTKINFIELVQILRVFGDEKINIYGLIQLISNIKHQNHLRSHYNITQVNIKIFKLT